MMEECGCCGNNVTNRMKEIEMEIDDYAGCWCNTTRRIRDLELEIAKLNRQLNKEKR